MKQTGMIPVFYYADFPTARSVFDACYRGGVRCFEFTNRGPEAFDVFSQLIAHAKKFNDVFLGIGTIMNASDAERFIAAGADFIVSPILKLEIGKVCSRENVTWIPGCATLTEIVTGHEAGADLTKIFPASVLGPEFVKAVRPVIPNIPLMPTGGVDTSESNLREWFKAGVHCVGMGSQLLDKQIIESGDWSALESKVKDAMHRISKIRS